MPNITTSLDKSLWEKAKDAKISWAEALKRGILALLNEPMPSFQGEEIVKETEMAKLKRANNAMQEKIMELSDIIERGGKNGNN